MVQEFTPDAGTDPYRNHDRNPMLRRIRDMVLQGVSVLGEPPLATPGLADYPRADVKLKALVEELGGNRNRTCLRNVKLGKAGFSVIFLGRSTEQGSELFRILFPTKN